ncbi:hypothetical protein [Streptomyces monashensis]
MSEAGSGDHSDPALRACLRWRNTRARHPDVLAAQWRERVGVRSKN